MKHTDWISPHSKLNSILIQCKSLNKIMIATLVTNKKFLHVYSIKTECKNWVFNGHNFTRIFNTLNDFQTNQIIFLQKITELDLNWSPGILINNCHTKIKIRISIQFYCIWCSEE